MICLPAALGHGTAASDIAASSSTGTNIFEEWSALSVAGKRSGFDSTIITRLKGPYGAPLYHTIEREEVVIKRMGTNLKMLDISDVTEDADGAVLSFKETSSGAGSNIESIGHREGDELLVSSRGQMAHYHLPRLAALGPAAVQRQTSAVPLKPGQLFSIATFETDYPQRPVLENGQVVGRETRRVNGSSRELWRITSQSSLSPGMTSINWVDDHNNDVESRITIPGIGQIEQIVTDRADCLRPPEGAELFTTALIHPQRAIPSPRRWAQAVYRISIAHGDQTPQLWDGGTQRVLKQSPGRSEIVVNAPEIKPADVTWQLPHEKTAELAPYLQASAYLESNTPIIQKLARRAIGPEKNPVRAALLIEKFVEAYISKKDLNVGFASAQETAESREGDCTEHAVLCAALGRAVGLPTRCVLGLGYIEPGADEPTISAQRGTDTGTFGFHMWAEAWVGPDQWVPMDAALDGFDVGHIAIAKSALDEVNPLADLDLAVLQLMQNLKIEVLKTVPRRRVAGPDPEID